jgi:hypothetical protein
MWMIPAGAAVAVWFAQQSCGTQRLRIIHGIDGLAETYQLRVVGQRLERRRIYSNRFRQYAMRLSSAVCE